MSASSTATRSELALLLAPALLLMRPTWWVGLAVAALWLLWRRAAPPARERWLFSGFLAVSLALLIAADLVEARARRAAAPSAEELARAYTRTWESLARDLEELSTALGRLPPAEGDGAAFRSLERLAAASLPSRTFLLLDPSGEPLVWGGAGLLHRLAVEELPASGYAARQGATSATLVALRQIVGQDGRTYRLVAAESRLFGEAPPLTFAEVSPPRWARWCLSARPPASAGWTLVASPGAPTLALEGPVEPARTVAPSFRSWSLALLGLGLFGLAALRGMALALLARTVLLDPARAWTAALHGWVGLLAIAWGMGAGRRETLILGVGLAVGALGWRLGRASFPGRPWLGAALGLAVLIGIAELAVPWPVDELDLISGMGFGVNLAAVRVGIAAAVFGALRCLPWRRVAAGTWVLALVLAVILSAAAWEVGARLRLESAATGELELLLPPGPARLAELDRGLAGHFARVDLARAVASWGVLDDRGDLAYALWRASPLARPDALSALALDWPGEPPSSFSYGLPLDDLGELDRSPARWAGLVPPAFRARSIAGEAMLSAAGAPVVRVRYWLVPRPGFGPRPRVIEDLAADLLRWSGARRRGDALPSRSPWVLYSERGEVELSPWKEATPTRAAVTAPRESGRVATPDGLLPVVSRRAEGLTAALFLRGLRPAARLERVAVHVAGALAAIAILGLTVLALALPRSMVRDMLGRTLRSYSKRLILLYSLLILLPLGLLYGLLSQALGQRIEREQRLAAEAALNSAQRVLGEYVLSLEPGFGLGTALDDALLEWLSRVVGHEIHLYWGGEVYASSKRELFAAGLLPRRLPGAVWERLALEGDRLVARAARAGRAEFLELYAALAVPGADPRRSRLFLAMPLLAQQEEAIAETERIQRRTLLATLAAFLLLAALGTRLARAFTRPITELVAGTQRIAAGATGLGVRPSGLELAALAEAIDQMARRIAEGRAQLLREKRLVDGIVEAVTSAVVYVDRAGNVLLVNRLARELLRVAPGDRLETRLELRPELAPAARFVGAAGEELMQETVRLAPTRGESRDWSLVWVPLAGGGEPGFLFIVEDISEVLRAQRLAAWAEMARIIAHEIKNPLTPIRLSAEHLREAWARDRDHFASVFERCTTNILKQVEELRGIASEFSTYSHIPAIDRQPGDLVATLREVVEMYRDASPGGVQVELAAGPPELAARFDGRLLARALRNLIENAMRASSGRGHVEVALEALDGLARIRVADDGPGVPEELLERIFEPYFSTHAGGTGLGLPIARRIVEEHEGTLTARNLPTGGLEVAITIPVR